MIKNIDVANTKKHPAIDEVLFRLSSYLQRNYGFFGAAVFAGFAASVFASFALFAGAFAAGAVVEWLAVLLTFELVVLAAAGVETGAGVCVLTAVLFAAGLLVALFEAASPQAMPKALRPRTVESTITFFILLMTPIFLKVYYLLPGTGRSNTAALS